MAETTRLRVSPYARRTAREWDLPLDTIRGTGPGGRIVWRDVDAARQRAQEEQTKKPPRGGAAAGYYTTADVGELLAALETLNGGLTLQAFAQRAAQRLETPLLLAGDGVEGMLPLLPDGARAVLALGAPENGRVRVHLAYDPGALEDGAAAELLRSMRRLLECPLLLLA